MSTPKKPPLVVREESERPLLARILVYEGAVSSVEELDVALVADELDAEAINQGYREVVAMVVGEDGYKAAAKLRILNSDKVNVSDASLEMFHRFSERARALGYDIRWPVLARALALHNAASALSLGNGNLPDEQLKLNREALALLETIPDADRDGDWWECFRKPYVGMVEAGHIPFDLFRYLRVVQEMIRNGSKDAPGRLEYLIPRCTRELSDMAQTVIDGKLGAENQRERLMGLLPHLQVLLTALAA